MIKLFCSKTWLSIDSNSLRVIDIFSFCDTHPKKISNISIDRGRLQQKSTLNCPKLFQNPLLEILIFSQKH